MTYICPDCGNDMHMRHRHSQGRDIATCWVCHAEFSTRFPRPERVPLPPDFVRVQKEPPHE